MAEFKAMGGPMLDFPLSVGEPGPEGYIYIGDSDHDPNQIITPKMMNDWLDENIKRQEWVDANGMHYVDDFKFTESGAVLTTRRTTTGSTVNPFAQCGSDHYEDDKTKCQHCGQWGEARSECGKCGAPIDPMPDKSNGVRVTAFGDDHESYLMPDGSIGTFPFELGF